MPSNANLHDGVGERVAKNLIKSAWIHALILQELQTHSCPGHKVMISATSLTVNLSMFAAGGPTPTTDVVWGRYCETLSRRSSGRLRGLLALEPMAREFERTAVLCDRADDIIWNTSGDLRVDLQRHPH